MAFKNDERRKQYQAQWALENKEKLIQQRKIYYQANKEYLTLKHKEWLAKNLNSYREKRKAAYLFKSYGISLSDYEGMLHERNSSCDICGKSFPKARLINQREDRLQVDHCHTTGKIRGLLCVNCNTGIGSFKEEKDLLEKAIDYLRRTNS